ncbi:MAG: hypothetical protein LBH97_07300, partial [Treponema sp.]|nr:hypothetical protein [Treponema sp.]
MPKKILKEVCKFFRKNSAMGRTAAVAKIWMNLPAEPRPIFPLQPGMCIKIVSSGRELQTIFAT